MQVSYRTSQETNVTEKQPSCDPLAFTKTSDNYNMVPICQQCSPTKTIRRVTNLFIESVPSVGPYTIAKENMRT